MELSQNLIKSGNLFLDLKEHLIKDCCNELGIVFNHNYPSVNILWVDKDTPMHKIEELEKRLWYFAVTKSYSKIEIYHIKDCGIKLIY